MLGRISVFAGVQSGRVAPALPVNEFQISAHLASAIYGDPTPSAVVETDAGTLMPRTLDRLIDNVPGYAFSAAYADVWGPEVRRMTLVRLYCGDRTGPRGRAAGAGPIFRCS